MTDDKFMPGASVAIGAFGSLSARKTPTGVRIVMTTDEREPQSTKALTLDPEEWEKFVKSQYPMAQLLHEAEESLQDVLDKLEKVTDAHV